MIHEFAIKMKIMGLIDSKDPQVGVRVVRSYFTVMCWAHFDALQIQQHSLLALQKLMVTNWEYLR